MAVSTYRAFELGPLATTTFNNVLDTDVGSGQLVLVLARCRALVIIAAVSVYAIAI